ncbi:MAG: PKD domain-containing protein [Candidatus Bipolaricaulaceae bacterium]
MWRKVFFAAVLAVPALAGTFLLKTDQLLLYQDGQRSTLLLANRLEDLAEEITLSFPAQVQLEEVYVHAGIMETRQVGREVVLSGALWRQGFVRLSWKPAFLLPNSVTIRSAHAEWTTELSRGYVCGEPELQRLPKGLLVGRSEGTGESLRIRFAEEVSVTQVLGIGCTPTWEMTDRELLLRGPFPKGSLILVTWNHPEVEVEEAAWNDRPVSAAPPGPWEVVELGEGRVRFAVTAPPGTSVLWDLGDGTASAQNAFEYTYPQEGKYLVTLVLSDSRGRRWVRQTWVTVERAAPSLATASGLPPHAVPGGPYGPFDLWWYWDEELGMEEYRGTVWFDASASQAPGSRIVRYIWDLGDGTRIVTTEPFLTHTYLFTWDTLPEAADGYYRIPVTLTVVDEFGRTSQASTYVYFRAFWAAE